MAYWMAYKNNRGNYKNYKCSECYIAAPQNNRKISVLSDTCPRCGAKMSYIGTLDNVPAIKK